MQPLKINSSIAGIIKVKRRNTVKQSFSTLWNLIFLYFSTNIKISILTHKRDITIDINTSFIETDEKIFLMKFIFVKYIYMNKKIKVDIKAFENAAFEIFFSTKNPFTQGNIDKIKILKSRKWVREKLIINSLRKIRMINIW